MLWASILFSASSVCQGQVETPKPEGGEEWRWVNPGGRLRRPEAAEPRASLPVTWEFPPPLHSEVSFSSPGALDMVFGAPDVLAGGAIHALSSLFHDAGCFDEREESRRSMAVRLTGAVDVDAPERPFESFMEVLYARERKTFSRWGESTQSTLAVEEGDEDIDGGVFLRDQRKVFVHALGRRYLGRYGDAFSDNLRREAFDFSRWEAIDFAIGPAFIGGYLYLRGWDGGLRWGDVGCRIHLQPLERIEGHLHKSNDILLSAASLEFSLGGIPIKAVVSGGVVDGRPAFDFIGLGTSVGMVRKAIKLEMDPLEFER